MKYDSYKIEQEIFRVWQAANRYETLRECTPRQFTELYQRNLRGENFDEMVDELTKQMEDK